MKKSEYSGIACTLLDIKSQAPPFPVSVPRLTASEISFSE